MVKSLLDSLLGGVKDLTAGQNMGQMASQLSAKARTTWEGQSTLTKGAVAGGLLAMLLSGNARKLVGTGAKIGGAALIGGLAFKAYEDWKSGKSTADANPDIPLALPPGEVRPCPPPCARACGFARACLQRRGCAPAWLWGLLRFERE
jgi:uncharacterized membrane protein YebE (DUF533 family)